MYFLLWITFWREEYEMVQYVCGFWCTKALCELRYWKSMIVNYNFIRIYITLQMMLSITCQKSTLSLQANWDHDPSCIITWKPVMKEGTNIWKEIWSCFFCTRRDISKHISLVMEVFYHLILYFNYIKI